MDTPAPIHLFSDFRSLGGGELHAVELARLLGPTRCQVWGNCAQPLAFGDISVQPVLPFQGVFPRGGTLVLIGAYSQPGLWLAHARPRRLILVGNTSQPQEFYTRIAQLRGETGLEVELAYVSEALRQAMLLPGRLAISPIDLQRFSPAALPEGSLVLGRHSRDILAKHHPGDVSLYRQLSLQGAAVRLLGGSCLAPHLGPDAGGVTLLPAGAEAPETFLRGLNCFFYRTDPGALVEAGGRVVQEALACGLPVVAGRQGGYAEWIEPGENGFLCDSQEEALAHLQTLAADHALRRRLSRGARQSALARWGEAARAELRAWYLA